MRNVKKILAFALALALCFSLCACSNSSSDESKLVTFTNLVDDSEISELSSVLVDNGIDKANVDMVMASVRDYNNTVGADNLKNNGALDLASPLLDYDNDSIDTRWLDKNELFIGYNCRLTAFELMKDLITVEDTTKGNLAVLFMDEDALDNSGEGYFNDDELARFEAIYSAIQTSSSTDVNEQYEVQKEYWDSIGIRFNTSDKLSLISVYIHNHYSDDENELIIGHAGVLLSTDDGYLFLEKLSFQLPYQLVKFNTKDELKQYLMGIYDTDTTGESAQPFILENDKLL